MFLEEDLLKKYKHKPHVSGLFQMTSTTDSENEFMEKKKKKKKVDQQIKQKKKKEHDKPAKNATPTKGIDMSLS